MADRKRIDEKPAYILYEGKSYYADEDLIGVPYKSINYGTMYKFYRLGSVVNFAITSGRCPFKMVEECKERGEELHWANPKTMALTSHKQDRFWAFYQPYGSTIKFHGKTFQIMGEHGNVHLKEIELADA